MKLSKLSCLGLLALAFASCQKTTERPSDLAVLESQSAITGAAAKNFKFSVNLSTEGTLPNRQICPGGTFTIDVSVTNPGEGTPGDGGNKSIELYEGNSTLASQTVEGTTASFTVTAPLVLGAVDYRVVYWQNSQKQSESAITINVVDCSVAPPPPGDCGAYGLVGLILEKETINYDENNAPMSYEQTFTLNPCNYSGYFKLQGGLTANASLLGCNSMYLNQYTSTTSAGYTILAKNGGNKNTVLNWISGVSGACGVTPAELAQGAPVSFKVFFTKQVKWSVEPITGRLFDYLMGAWSVKGKNGQLLDDYSTRLKVYKVN